MSDKRKIGSKVQITMDGPASWGAKIVVDGTEVQQGVQRAVLDLKAGKPGRLELYMIGEVVFDGIVDVERIHVCPECQERLEKELLPGTVAIVETTPLDAKWKRKLPIAMRTDEGEIKR